LGDVDAEAKEKEMQGAGACLRLTHLDLEKTRNVSMRGRSSLVSWSEAMVHVQHVLKQLWHQPLQRSFQHVSGFELCAGRKSARLPDVSSHLRPLAHSVPDSGCVPAPDRHFDGVPVDFLRLPFAKPAAHRRDGNAKSMRKCTSFAS